MKKIKFFTIYIILLFTFSCEDDNNIGIDTVSITIEDLYAPQEGSQGQSISGPFTKFNFEDGVQTESETNWDIGFRGTSIIVNGGFSLGTDDEPERNGNAGAYIHNGLFTELESVDNDLFLQDSEEGYAIQTGSGNGWYTYTSAPNYLINPIPGRVLVFRTRDNKYAKVEIISYYFDAPENPDSAINESRYYTFNYVYQSELGNTSFN